MKAAVYRGKQKLEVMDVDIPQPDVNEVLIKVKYCAICGTDVHAFMYDVPPAGTVMGHEFSGTIVRVGQEVTRLKEGMRVVGGGGAPPPGKERPMQVAPRFEYSKQGFSGRMQAYAEYVIMDDWAPIPIPEGVSDKEAALCEPTAVAVHAVRKSALKLGDSIVIFGAGPIGMFTVQVSKAAGANKVIVFEPNEVRAHAAIKLGADAVYNPLEVDPVEISVDLTDGMGPDVVFDCAGVKATLDQSLSLVRRSGQVMLVAVIWENIQLLPVDWSAREVSLQVSFASPSDDWRIALDLFKSGKVDIGPMLSDVDIIPLDRIQSAFESLTKPTNELQVLVEL